MPDGARAARESRPSPPGFDGIYLAMRPHDIFARHAGAYLHFSGCRRADAASLAPFYERHMWRRFADSCQVSAALMDLFAAPMRHSPLGNFSVPFTGCRGDFLSPR